MQSESIPAEVAAKMQRLIDLTALLERLNNKLIYGAQPTTKEYETLSDANREYGELLGQFSLRPPHRSC
ncbi:TPA: hypothetical protein ACP3ZG_000678 [Pseudomonas aeruginosa]|jgi:hypothetical protein|uniref:hypothetical protein n=1 Tax=Pseudomonas TaxID=286 RepID=UPI0011474058|nr:MULTISPECIES: hypothetical protein [Pseudomonas]MBI6605477.1 hypothetical protein [Pseudomonas sp. S4_EA_1b]MBI8857408.1 hypothetical protein [Pseudomonas aeruginosa]MEA8592602.1 hypothetical protein [Pseudomonas aeruginosa]HDU2624887.1 hypothetical protein [Pseudomonas aeruginosa]